MKARILGPNHQDERHPAAPHDPTERSLVLELGPWEVRTFAGRFLAYFAPRGLLHIQYWHAEKGISVLSPSRLTRARYEVRATDQCTMHFANWEGVQTHLEACHGVVAPTELEAFHTESVLVSRLGESVGGLAS